MSLCHALVVTAWFPLIMRLVNGCQKVLLCKGYTMGCFNIRMYIRVLCVQAVSSTSQTQSIDQERDLNVIYCLHNIFTRSWPDLIQTRTKYMGKSNICSNMARPVGHCVETKVLLIFLLDSAVRVVFHSAFTISDISLLWFSALGKWKFQHPLLSIEVISSQIKSSPVLPKLNNNLVLSSKLKVSDNWG